MTAPNQNLSYPEFRATAGWKPEKDEHGSTIGPRSFEEWRATRNLPAPDHEVTVSISPTGAIDAAQEGRIKNVFHLEEEGRNNRRSDAYMDNRSATEHHILGLDYDAAADRRPVYGHVRETGHADAEGTSYGRVALDLWPGKNHITTTRGDSLDKLLDEHPYADPTRQEAWETTGFGDLEGHDADKGLDWGDYREAQIHGRIPMSPTHIKRAEVRQGDLGTDAQVVSSLRERGIPTTVVRQWEQPSMFTDEHITQTTPAGRSLIMPEYHPLTRSQHFWAGIPKEWEGGKIPASYTEKPQTTKRNKYPWE